MTNAAREAKRIGIEFVFIGGARQPGIVFVFMFGVLFSTFQRKIRDRISRYRRKRSYSQRLAILRPFGSKFYRIQACHGTDRAASIMKAHLAISS